MYSTMRISSSVQELPTYTKVNSTDWGSTNLSDSNSLTTKGVRTLQREGGSSSFSKEKTPPSSPTKRKRCIRAFAGFIVLFIVLSIIFASVKYFGIFQSHGSQYYVVLDCGSTGTRVYIYEWSAEQNKENTKFPIALKSLSKFPKKKAGELSGRAYQRMETEPGFHKLVRNESGLRDAIWPLLKAAEKRIPKHMHKDTHLFLYATAGVRRLPLPDSTWLMDNTWNILRNSSFSCTRDNVKVISGMEEAYFGWLALNHHLGRLGSSSTSTYGSLDLGGSSLQVTFENEKSGHEDSNIILRIGTSSHQLSAYSLSGYGLNDAFDRSVMHLLRRHDKASIPANGGTIQLEHPCLQTGYIEDYVCSTCIVHDQDGMPKGVTVTSNGKQGIPVRLIGAPQWEECSNIAKITVNLSEWLNSSSPVDCSLKPCALAGHLPEPHGQFYAMSGFFVVFKFFNLSSDATLVDVLKRGKEFCEMPWDAAKSSVAPQPFIEQYCFRAPYVTSLLRDGLHINDNQVTIGSGSITWTLGVALLEAGKALSNRIDLQGYTVLHREMDLNILFVLVLMSAVLVLCAILCVNNWYPRMFRKSYLPVHRQNSTSGLNIPSPFKFQLWSPINTGEGRVKMPLSPTVGGSEGHPFHVGTSLSRSSIQLMEYSMQSSGVPYSYSVGSLGQMQFANGMYQSNRGTMTLQSRRSQSREDLSLPVADLHIAKG